MSEIFNDNYYQEDEEKKPKFDDISDIDENNIIEVKENETLDEEKSKFVLFNNKFFNFYRKKK